MGNNHSAPSKKEEKLDFNGNRKSFLLANVRIVVKKDTKRQMALKYINKKQCLQMSAVANIFREKAILIEVQHPFVVNLRYAYQDDDNMFMVIDLMLGGDLRYQLDKNQSLNEEQVRYIIAECACAVAYLHSHEIVHRDLKPENILLDEFGHAHLTDFNIAVHFLENKPLSSRSAPEVFGKVGYRWHVDWWSLGIVLFEILFGKRPFRGSSQEDTANAICTQELIIPEINLFTNESLIVSPNCANMILRMLERTIPSRMCCGPEGFAEFENHPWYEGLDWRALERKEIRPPFIPESNKDNFDISHDLEELLLDDNPLRYRKPDKSLKGGKSSSKMDDIDDDEDSDGSVPKIVRANRSDPSDQNNKPGQRVASVNSVASSCRYHPLDYDPYLQALQRNEHPEIKGKQLSSLERMELELDYIRDKFSDYNCEKQGRGLNDLAEPETAEGKTKHLGSVSSPSELRYSSNSKNIAASPLKSSGYVNHNASQISVGGTTVSGKLASKKGSLLKLFKSSRKFREADDSVPSSMKQSFSAQSNSSIGSSRPK